MNSDEIWAGTGFPGYEVSNMGRVRNLGGQVVRCGKPGGFRTIPPKILKPFVVKGTGYMQVLMPDRKKHSVHRLVAKAFCDGFAEGLVVDHINNKRDDNRASNLRWLTPSQNVSRPYKEDGLEGPSRGLYGGASPKHTAIIATCIKTGEVRNFAAAIDAVKEIGFDSGAISKCCHGKQPSHKGWMFRFVDGGFGYPHKKTKLLPPDA